MKSRVFNISKTRDPNRANQYGVSIINNIKKVRILINDAKNLSRKDMLNGKASLKVSRRVLDTLKNEFGLVYGKKAKSIKSKYNIKKLYKHSSTESINEHENGEIDDATLRKRFYTKKRRDEMSISERQKIDKERYKEIKADPKLLAKKNKRNRKYLENLTEEKLKKRKAQETLRAKKRWKNMTLEDRARKLIRDRKYQKERREKQKLNKL